MSFMQDLAVANSMLTDAADRFQKNVRQLQVQRSIGQANQMVQEIKAAEGDEQQKRAQLQNLANSLVMDLAQFGAPAETTQMVAGAIRPPERFFQTAEQALINPDMATPQQREVAQSLYQDEMGLKKQALDDKKILAQSAAEEKQNTKIFRAIESGQKRVDSLARKSVEALEAAQTMREMLLSNNDIADSAVTTFSARATGEVGNLTEAERKPFGSSMAIKSKLKQIAYKAATGRLTDENRQYLLKLSETFENSARRNIRKHQENVGKQLASNLKVPLEEVYSRLIPDYVAGEGSRAPQAGAAPAPGAAPQIPGLKFIGGR